MDYIDNALFLYMQSNITIIYIHIQFSNYIFFSKSTGMHVTSGKRIKVSMIVKLTQRQSNAQYKNKLLRNGLRYNFCLHKFICF